MYVCIFYWFWSHRILAVHINIYKWVTTENFRLKEVEKDTQSPESSQGHIFTPVNDSCLLTCIQRSNFNWFDNEKALLMVCK